MRNNAQLTPRQKRFCAALLTARTVAEAGAVVGIHPRQSFKYLELEAVRAELARLIDQAEAGAVRQAVNAMGAAVATLEDICVDEQSPASVRVSAARAILECGIKLRSELDLAERITRLEERVYNDTETEEYTETGCD